MLVLVALSKLYVEILNDGEPLTPRLEAQLTKCDSNTQVVIDYSTESNSYFDSSKNIFKTIHEIVENAKIKPENVTLYTGNLVVYRAYSRFLTHFQGIKPFKKVEYKDFWLRQTVEMHKEYVETNTDLIKPKYYSSLNRACRSHREMAREYLMYNDLLDKGICSFIWIGESADGISDTNDYFHYVKENTKDFNSVFDNTYYDLITETNTGLESPDWFLDVFFTEKLWRSVYYKRPFLLIGNYRSLHYLKEMGFKTFDGVLFDESYDEEADHLVRIEKVLKENKRIIQTKSLKELHRIMNSTEMCEILQHNYKMINNIAKHNS